MIETLAKAGVPVGVMVAPVIPGVNDRPVSACSSAARDAGATAGGVGAAAVAGRGEAGVRGAVARGDAAGGGQGAASRPRDARRRELYDARFHTRGRGQGAYADTIAMMFETAVERLG